jgi:hypothetical protein
MRYRIRILLAVLVLFIGSSSTGAQNATARRGSVPALDQWLSGIPKEFDALYQFVIPSQDMAAVWAGLPCDSLSFEHTIGRSGYGGVKPADRYEVTLRRNASGSSGRGPAELTVTGGTLLRYGITGPGGDFVGTINIGDYGKLCHLARQLRFDSLAASYSRSNVPGEASQYAVTIETAGSRKTVSDQGYGPLELWALQKAIESVAEGINWQLK